MFRVDRRENFFKTSWYQKTNWEGKAGSTESRRSTGHVKSPRFSFPTKLPDPETFKTANIELKKVRLKLSKLKKIRSVVTSLRDCQTVLPSSVICQVSSMPHSLAFSVHSLIRISSSPNNSGACVWKQATETLRYQIHHRSHFPSNITSSFESVEGYWPVYNPERQIEYLDLTL